MSPGDLTDAPQLEGETMSVVPLPLEMRARSSRKVLLILGWVFLTLGCVVTIFAGGVRAIVGLFGLAFFGYAGVKLFRQRSDLAGLALTPAGVKALGLSATIPWSEIAEIGVGSYSHNKLVGFNVHDVDRLISRLTATELRDLTVLRATLKPVSTAMGAAGVDPGTLPELASGNLKHTFAVRRREIGWDVIVMQVYLDRPVEEAAAILEAARQQQIADQPGL